MARPVILSIAGSDPSGGAGIQADIQAILANGGVPAAAVAALTVQNSLGVLDTRPVEAAFVAAQAGAVLDDLPVKAVKTGMLGTASTVEAVAVLLEKHPGIPLVVDPVLRSSSGAALLSGEGLNRMVRRLFPLAALVMPNVMEAERLAGRTIRTLEDASAAGVAILEAGARAVLVKGGHLFGEPGTDVLIEGGRESRFPGRWIEQEHTHGTGCVYSAAVATGLGRGMPLEEAVGSAREYVQEAIRHGFRTGAGVGPVDPVFGIRRPAQGEP